MNSSTKPPISSSAKKFQFDVDFEQESERLRVDSLRQHEKESHVEVQNFTPAQVFSEDEVNMIREESLHAGIRQGRLESLQETEQNIAVLTGVIADKLGELLAAELQREKLFQEIAVKTTLGTIKKIWPQILNKCGMEIVETTIRQSMDNNSEETRIVVRVHDSMLDAVVSRLPQLQQQQAFAGKVIIIADQNVIAGDCKIEWADGGLDRLSRTLSQQLDMSLDRILASISTFNADPERISQ